MKNMIKLSMLALLMFTVAIVSVLAIPTVFAQPTLTP